MTDDPLKLLVTKLEHELEITGLPQGGKYRANVCLLRHELQTLLSAVVALDEGLDDADRLYASDSARTIAIRAAKAKARAGIGEAE